MQVIRDSQQFGLETRSCLDKPQALRRLRTCQLDLTTLCAQDFIESNAILLYVSGAAFVIQFKILCACHADIIWWVPTSVHMHVHMYICVTDQPSVWAGSLWISEYLHSSGKRVVRIWLSGPWTDHAFNDNITGWTHGWNSGLNLKTCQHTHLQQTHTHVCAIAGIMLPTPPAILLSGLMFWILQGHCVRHEVEGHQEQLIQDFHLFLAAIFRLGNWQNMVWNATQITFLVELYSATLTSYALDLDLGILGMASQRIMFVACFFSWQHVALRVFCIRGSLLDICALRECSSAEYNISSRPSYGITLYASTAPTWSSNMLEPHVHVQV